MPDLSFRLEKHEITRPITGNKYVRWLLIEKTGLQYEPSPQLVELWLAHQELLNATAKEASPPVPEKPRAKK